MIRVVADASVAVKWALAFRDGEQDSDKALALLAPGYTLVTSDERYYRKAHEVGSIMLLRDFDAAAGESRL